MLPPLPCTCPVVALLLALLPAPVPVIPVLLLTLSLCLCCVLPLLLLHCCLRCGRSLRLPMPLLLPTKVLPPGGHPALCCAAPSPFHCRMLTLLGYIAVQIPMTLKALPLCAVHMQPQRLCKPCSLLSPHVVLPFMLPQSMYML